MKLKFKDLENKDVIFVPEDNVISFTNKTLKNSVNELYNILGRAPSDKDIQNFLLANIIKSSKNINGLTNLLFSSEPRIDNDSYVWNVIINNNVIILDNYLINTKGKALIFCFKCEIHILDDNKFEVNIDAFKELKNRKNFDKETLTLIAMFRLLYYIVALSQGDIKYKITSTED